MRHKLRAHTRLAAQLLATGTAHLVKRAPHDAFWGDGPNGHGENMLGNILMRIRRELRRDREGYATAMTWRVSDPPTECERLPCTLPAIDWGLYDRIERGHIPMEMEDKWFIFLTDGMLRFHRSWTGACIYWVEVGFDEGYTLTRAWVSRDARIYAWPEGSEGSRQEVDTLLSLLTSRFGLMAH